MKFIVFFYTNLWCLLAHAQTNSDSLHKSGKAYLQHGNFDSALLTLNQALTQKPDDLEILKDQALANYLKRDFAKAIEIGKNITERTDADVQSYQLLGTTYKAIANYKEGQKLYERALNKFSNSGVLYSEYGDLLAAEKNEADAIKQWEKGIETDANSSSNYYYAAKFYAQHENVLKALLYGETFVNIESFTNRTSEIKEILLANYVKLFSGDVLNEYIAKGTDFEKAISETYSKLSNMVSGGITAETLTSLRSEFISDWFKTKAAQFPYRLFDHHRLLINQKIFNAYNQWLFATSANYTQFQSWMNNHSQEMRAFQNYKRSVVYKIPQGQYYTH